MMRRLTVINRWLLIMVQVDSSCFLTDSGTNCVLENILNAELPTSFKINNLNVQENNLKIYLNNVKNNPILSLFSAVGDRQEARGKIFNF